MQRVNHLLDSYVLPWPVKFLTNRLIILMTIGLLAPLIVFAHSTDFVLAVNSYLNTMSVAVSSIVLLYATVAEIRDRQIAAMHERRAQEDHSHVVEMHQLVLENMKFQHEEIEDLKQILSQMHGIRVPRKEFRDGQAVDLRAMHPRGRARFTEDHVGREMGEAAGGGSGQPS